MTITRSPQTKKELQAELAVLVREAESNGVNVEGGYELDSTTGAHIWGLEFFPVIKREQGSRGRA
ncbi:hypothetical protein [Halomarina litorea]|uniref:hypothetical protein n=1 Tax=Halomarina litorea TaxID=2961595 RepID=UPI0020C27216|nr:hypothetical protein [Halomarina sp. BCD28]